MPTMRTTYEPTIDMPEDITSNVKDIEDFLDRAEDHADWAQQVSPESSENFLMVSDDLRTAWFIIEIDGTMQMDTLTLED